MTAQVAAVVAVVHRKWIVAGRNSRAWTVVEQNSHCMVAVAVVAVAAVDVVVVGVDAVEDNCCCRPSFRPSCHPSYFVEKLALQEPGHRTDRVVPHTQNYNRQEVLSSNLLQPEVVVAEVALRWEPVRVRVFHCVR